MVGVRPITATAFPLHIERPRHEAAFSGAGPGDIAPGICDRLRDVALDEMPLESVFT